MTETINTAHSVCVCECKHCVIRIGYLKVSISAPGCNKGKRTGKIYKRNLNEQFTQNENEHHLLAPHVVANRLPLKDVVRQCCSGTYIHI